MDGLMQDTPLLIPSLLEHAAMNHPDVELVTHLPDNSIHRTTYQQTQLRTKCLASALLHQLGVKMGDTVATISWNGWRHFELFFAVSGIGAILNPVNPRLFTSQIEYIMNHSNPVIIFVDPYFQKLVEGMREHIKCKRYVLLCNASEMPTTTHNEMHLQAICYETIIASANASISHPIHQFLWPSFRDTLASALCYTSGTTGNPKGVLYNHRATVIHAIAACTVDAMGINSNDCLLLVVPMYHANGWGLPFAASCVGAKIVFPTHDLEGNTLYNLITNEKVTFSCGVPTVWMNFFHYIDSKENIPPPSSLQRIIIAGSAAPVSLIVRFQKMGVKFTHLWGMTEMSPMGVFGHLLPKHQQLDSNKKLAILQKQGRPIYGVEMKLVDDEGKELPRDGGCVGSVLVRGPWISSGYYKSDDRSAFRDSWLITGDVATIDSDGFMQITDRAKDVIKSGGEWISSIALENEAVSHPGVAEACVIGVHHEKWQERPLLFIVLKKGHHVNKEEILNYLGSRVARWWVPDDVLFVASLPHTATGKLNKLALRQKYKNYLLPGDDPNYIKSNL